MNTVSITLTKELEVPLGALIEVTDLLLDHDIHAEIAGTDDEEDSIIIDVSYTKEQRDIIHQVESVITDFYDNEEEGTDEEEKS